MTQNAINGSAINQTSFPGAEAGLSLVQLVGTVQVTCSIPSVSLRLTAVAATQATASGTISTSKRTQFTCQVSAAATTSATALNNRRNGATGIAVCAASAGVGLKYRPSATASGTAFASPVSGYLHAARNAIALCIASTPATAARTLTRRSAITEGVAGTTANSVRKVPSHASGNAFATVIASIRFRNRLGASTIPTAGFAVSTRFNVRRGASVAPSAVVSALVRTNINLALPVQSAVATASEVLSLRKMSFGATTQANAYANATIRLRYRLSGSVVARALAQSAASDFASAMPAPAERLMKVPASRRRMEVTE